jgi:hypothetical protein
MLSWFACLLLSFALAAPTWAATKVSLYQERVIVSGNATQQEQNSAIKLAFKRLLVRVTGIRDSLKQPTILAELDKGSRYLSSFRFEASSQFFTNILGEKVATKAMVLDFDEATVNALLIQNRLPVWGARRPDVLIWLADRLGGQDHILADNETTELAQLVTAEAAGRGVPLLLPIMDLSDTLNLSFADLNGLFSQDIEAASERYSAEAVLAGRILQRANGFSADWLLLFRDERIRLPEVTGTLADVVSAGIDMVAERLSEQYAFVLDPLLLGTIRLQVVNINDLAEFATIERYLQTINLITGITVHHFGASDVVFDLAISGDRMQLADLLSLDSQLVVSEQTSLEATLDNILYYQWLPN